MAKPLFQDIVPPDRRSITRVPVPNRQARRGERPNEATPVSNRMPARHIRVADDEPEGEEKLVREVQGNDHPTASAETMRASKAVAPVSTPPPMRRVPFYEERDPYRRHFPWKASIVFLCALAIIAGTYLVLSHYAKATITVTPQTESLSLNNQFTGILTSTSSPVASASTGVSYTVISITKDGALSVASTGQTTTNTKATGQIIIFNSYSTSPQKLVSGTRFSTPSGLIYRTSSAVTVPGKTSKAPGSVTVTVTADAAGSQYNVGLSDFTVPGLSGTPAYSGMYGRSKTTMTGGFSGVQAQVDPSTLAAAEATIDAELEGTLLQNANQEVPSGDVLLPSAYVVSYTHLPTAAASSSQAVVSEEGTINAFAFNSTQLAAAFAGTGTSSLNAIWKLGDVSSLNFAVTASSTGANQSANQPWNASSMPFQVTGPINLVAAVDIQKIQENLAGKQKSDFTPILSGFPEVASAVYTLEPFWQQTFPVSSKNIIVNLSP